VLELKQFKRIVLEPGETRKLEFTIPRAQLASLQPNMRYALNPGTYRVAIGPNSAQLVEARFEVPALKDDRLRNEAKRVLPATVWSKRAKAAVSGR
jgi:hypothetical protein